jgi:ribonuclease BN (tRNA processing enzyme)
MRGRSHIAQYEVGVAVNIHVLGYWGAYPEAGEATTGLLVQTDTANILLDCGSGVLSQLFKLCKFEDLTAVIVTHHHHDHAADLGVLGYTALIHRQTGTRKQPLPVYMPSGSPQIESAFEHEPLIQLQRITDTSRIDIAGIDVTFARTQHPVYCLAVRMNYRGRTFVFSADSALCPNLQQLAQGADLFLCEANMYDGQEEAARKAGHLTAGQAGTLAREAGVKKLALTHYPHHGNLDDLIRQASAAFQGPVERVHTLKTLQV